MLSSCCPFIAVALMIVFRRIQFPVSEVARCLQVAEVVDPLPVV